MKFMDKKEQVLDIQLTPYGEYLLSQGTFKPEYYAFYDDNVLYESQYAGHTEVQNSIEPRVQEDTPQLETQTVFSSRDLYIDKSLTRIVDVGADPFGVRTELDAVGADMGGKAGDLVTGAAPVDASTIVHYAEIAQSAPDITDTYFDRYNYSLRHLLGTSDRMKTDAPAWSVSFLKNEISSSSSALTGANTPVLNIPQINSTIEYKISSVGSVSQITDTELAIEFEGGQFLDIKPDYILAQIIEKNSEFVKENFNIEVFEVTEKTFEKNSLSETITTLRPLKFRKPIKLVQDGILLDLKEIPVSSEPITKDYVEYYFDIKVDDRIDRQIICSSISELESRSLYVDTEIICEDIKNVTLADIYSTDASAPPCPDPVDGLDCPDPPGSIFIPTISNSGGS